jgi:DNA-directed RNA polymerase subunit RPC12/RpoP
MVICRLLRGLRASYQFGAHEMRADYPDMVHYQEYRCTHCSADFWYKWKLPGPAQIIYECPNCRTFIGIGYVPEDEVYCMPSHLARQTEKESPDVPMATS